MLGAAQKDGGEVLGDSCQTPFVCKSAIHLVRTINAPVEFSIRSSFNTSHLERCCACRYSRSVSARSQVVVVSATLPISVGQRLANQRVRELPEGRYSRSELLGQLADADALISLLTDRVDAELLDAAPRLKVVANVAVGYDNVDLEAATMRGVWVTNTPGVLTEATADFAFALLLAAARRVVEGDQLVRGGAWRGWEPTQLLGRSVAGQVLGIVGMGRIGRAVARRAHGFGMPVLYSTRSGAPVEVTGEARCVPLEQLFARSDFVSLHCPLTPRTTHLIDESVLRAMKPSAILVNTARGRCVDEQALARALHRNDIAGAGLDVFENEPAVHSELLTCRTAVLAPHAASATTSTRSQMASIAIEAVASALQGRMPKTCVNPNPMEVKRDASY